VTRPAWHGGPGHAVRLSPAGRPRDEPRVDHLLVALAPHRRPVPGAEPRPGTPAAGAETG